jgi:hypothetical protein
MKRDDEITKLALDYLSRKEHVEKRIGDAFACISRAPLAKLIDEFLSTSPKIDVAPLLKRIADTNQGRLEDLNMPVFRSYLIAACEVSELDLRRLIATLDNFQRYNISAADAQKEVQIAARDETNSGHKSTKLGDLLKQREKRIR